MVDFLKPVLEDPYADFMTYLKQRDDAIATLFDSASHTNIPDKAIRYNRTSKRLEEFSAAGSTWSPKEISGLAAGSVTSAVLANDSINSSKLLFENNTFLRGKDASSNTINLIGTNAAGDTQIDTRSGGVLKIREGTTDRWSVSRHLIPSESNTATIGSSGSRVDVGYFRVLANVQSIDSSGNSLLIGPLTAHDLNWRTNNILHWTLEAGGILRPNGQRDLGTIGNPIGTLTALNVTSGTGPLSLTSQSGSYVALNATWRAYTNNFEPSTDNERFLGAQHLNINTVWANRFQNRTGDIWLLPQNGGTSIGAFGQLKVALSNTDMWPVASGYSLGNTNQRYGQVWAAEILNRASTMFVGTTDNVPVVIRQNNVNKLEFIADGHMNFANAPYVGGAGSAGGHVGYLQCYINGVQRKIPVYAVS